MTPPDDITAALVLLVAACVLGTLGAWVFRGAALPGGRRAAGLVAGIVVGLLAGTGGVMALAPDAYDAWFVGGQSEREALIAFDSETAAHVEAIRRTGVTDVAIDEHRARRAVEREPLEDAYDHARRSRAGTLDRAIAIALGVLIACAAPYWLPRERAGRSTGGLGAFVGVVLLAALAGTLLRATSPTLPMWAVMTIGCVAATLCCAPSARATGRLVAWSVLGFFVCITVARLLGFVTGTDTASPSSLAGTTGVAVVLLLVGWLPYQIATRARQLRTRRALGAAAYSTLLPGIVALTVARLDTPALWTDWVFWIALVAMGFASSDLRWYALARIMRSVGRETPYTDAARCANEGGGVAQFVVALALHGVGAIDDGLLLALLIGGALGEMTVALRTRVARAFEKGEPLMSIVDEDEQQR